MSDNITIISTLNNYCYSTSILNLLTNNFINSRYSNLNNDTIKLFINNIILNNGIFVTYGNPPIAICHTILKNIKTEAGNIDTIFIGGMCVCKKYRKQGIGEDLLNAIGEYYQRFNISNYALFCKNNSQGFYHAQRNGFTQKISWYKYIDKLYINNLLPISSFNTFSNYYIPNKKLININTINENDYSKTMLNIGLFGNKLFIATNSKGVTYLLSKERKYFRTLSIM
jgi:hypothetical protein